MKIRTLTFAALLLAAALSQIGCATSALHNHMLHRDASAALHHTARGRPALAADGITDFWTRSDWDVIREHWPLYLLTGIVDVVAGYYIWQGLRGDDRDAPGDVTNITHNYPPPNYADDDDNNEGNAP